MYGFDLTAALASLILAGNTVACSVPQAPQISVEPSSAPIQYEYSLSSAQLDAFKSNTVSPYAPGTDSSTGGLRHDRPKIGTQVVWGKREYTDLGVFCLWYKEIKVTIELSPKIYVAKEHKDKKCRQAIMNHEIKHVDVDREVINQYAMGIGQAVKQAVDGIGAMGPYNNHEREKIEESLISHVRTAVKSQEFLLYQEMARRQAQVDTLAEYESVTKICEGSKR